MEIDAFYGRSFFFSFFFFSYIHTLAYEQQGWEVCVDRVGSTLGIIVSVRQMVGVVLVVSERGVVHPKVRGLSNCSHLTAFLG